MRKTWATKLGRVALFVLVVLLGAPIAIAINESLAAGSTIREGTTSSFGVLAASTVTNTGPTSISGTAGGYVGLYPGTSFTGSAAVARTGDHIADDVAKVAQADLSIAYSDLGIPAPTILSSPDLVGRVVLPGTYATSAGTFSNSGKLTLDAQGDPSAVFIFQAASTVITSTNSTMALINGAQACNVYWQVGSSATLGVGSTFIGNVYAVTSITATTGAKIYGQLLARNGAVTLDTNTIVNNNCSVAPTTTARATTTTIFCPTATTVRPTATTVRQTATTVRPTTTTVRQTTVCRTTTTVRSTVTPSTARPTATATTVRAVTSTSTVLVSRPTLPPTM